MINYLMQPPKKSLWKMHEASLFSLNPLPCQVQYYHCHMHKTMNLKRVSCLHEPATGKTLEKIVEKNRVRLAGN